MNKHKTISNNDINQIIKVIYFTLSSLLCYDIPKSLKKENDIRLPLVGFVLQCGGDFFPFTKLE